MLQKNKNVANNVVNENSQDLTEKWKKGELQSGWYYVKCLCENEDRIDYYNASFGCWTFNDKYIKQVLAPVPSYDEWKLMLDDNKRLKHDVGNLGYKIKNQRKEIERQIAQNAQLKELLKEVKDYLPEFETPMDILAKIDEALQ